MLAVATRVAVPRAPLLPPADHGEPLTEAQLLAMEEDDYMNEAQLAFFRARLVALRLVLQEKARETDDELRATAVTLPDLNDQASIEQEHALELRTRDRERKLMKKIEEALVRIDHGDYGWCEETGEPIGLPRLLARPTATLTVEAQQRRELRQKLYRA
jgi:DnaK suppressor protein